MFLTGTPNYSKCSFISGTTSRNATLLIAAADLPNLPLAHSLHCAKAATKLRRIFLYLAVIYQPIHRILGFSLDSLLLAVEYCR